MGFMDKVKAQAQTLAEKAQEGAKVGQEKLSAMQAKRQSDALLLELGGIVYAERVGRASPGSDDQISALVTRLQAFEAEHGQVQVTPADPPTGATGSYIPGSGGAASAGGSSIPTGSGMTEGAPPADTGSDAGAEPSASSPPASGGIPTGSYSSESSTS